MAYTFSLISCMYQQGWQTNSKDICTHSAAMFSSKCEKHLLYR